jgi:PPP family 3-phenylpropionic acid transporter
MHRIIPVLGVRVLLLITLALTALRWLLIGFFPDNTSILFFAQLFHAFSFGVFHAVGILLVHQFFTGKHQGRGQALYSSLSFGAGGALGSLIAGYLWAGFGPAQMYIAAAAVAVVAVIVTWRGVRGVT